MSNGRIDRGEEQSEPTIYKELMALFLIILGIAGAITGLWRLFGFDAVLLAGGLTFCYLGYRLGLSATGKD